MPEITNLSATPETDARLRAEYMDKGRAAFLEGADRASHPNGLIGMWWLEGYDGARPTGHD